MAMTWRVLRGLQINNNILSTNLVLFCSSHTLSLVPTTSQLESCRRASELMEHVRKLRCVCWLRFQYYEKKFFAWQRKLPKVEMNIRNRIVVRIWLRKFFREVYTSIICNISTKIISIASRNGCLRARLRVSSPVNTNNFCESYHMVLRKPLDRSASLHGRLDRVVGRESIDIYWHPIEWGEVHHDKFVQIVKDEEKSS